MAKEFVVDQRFVEFYIDGVLDDAERRHNREYGDRPRDHAGRDGECRGRSSASSRNLSRERRREEPLLPPRIMIDPIVGRVRTGVVHDRVVWKQR
jgi:hypothetical protein